MSTQPLPEQEKQNGRKFIILINGTIILVLATFLLIFGQNLFGNDTTAGDASNSSTVADTNNVQLPTSGGPLAVGDTAYEFQLVNLEGETVTLSDHIGHPIVINFWASWCAPCRIEMPELQAVFDQYEDQGLVMLAVNQGETADTASLFFRDQMGLTFTSPLLDEETLVYQNYGAFNLPTTYFIDAQGTVTAIHRGPAVQSQLEGYLAEILPEG